MKNLQENSILYSREYSTTNKDKFLNHIPNGKIPSEFKPAVILVTIIPGISYSTISLREDHVVDFDEYKSKWLQEGNDSYGDEFIYDGYSKTNELLLGHIYFDYYNKVMEKLDKTEIDFASLKIIPLIVVSKCDWALRSCDSLTTDLAIAIEPMKYGPILDGVMCELYKEADCMSEYDMSFVYLNKDYMTLDTLNKFNGLNDTNVAYLSDDHKSEWSYYFQLENHTLNEIVLTMDINDGK